MSHRLPPLRLAPMARLLLAGSLVLSVQTGCALLGGGSPEDLGAAAKDSAQSRAQARADEAVAGARGRVRVPDAEVPTYPDADGVYRDVQGRPIELSASQKAAAEERLQTAGKETGGGLCPGYWGKAKAALRAQATARDLTIGGRWLEGRLHCGRDSCSAWYRLRVDSKQRVVVEADGPADPALPDFELALFNASKERLGLDAKPLQRPRRLSETLPAGIYWVNVVTGSKHEMQLSYKLRARPYRAPRRTVRTQDRAPEPKPRLVAVEGGLLEVERDGGEPVSVLIDVGTGEGLAVGQQGKLVEGGQVIGRIEVVDVYAQGSRARILGALSAPITLQTRAMVMKPAR